MDRRVITTKMRIAEKIFEIALSLGFDPPYALDEKALCSEKAVGEALEFIKTRAL